MDKQKSIQNIELKIISILQGNTSKENRMSIDELTVRVYRWDDLRNEDGTLKPLKENDKEDSKYLYERKRVIKNGILNILEAFSPKFPIGIYAPLVAIDDEKFHYIDEESKDSKHHIYKDKHIFTTTKELDEYCEKFVQGAEAEKIEQFIRSNSIDLSCTDNKSRTAFPEINDWEVYYQQSYTNVEAFIILSSLMNQKNIESSLVDDIIRKLIISTSDSHFEEFVKTINLDALQVTTADEYLAYDKNIVNNCNKLSWNVLTNIETIIQAIITHKKISFERIYYSCDYQTKRWMIQNPTSNGHEKRNDKYNTENGNLMPCPLDLMTNISISVEDGCLLEDIKFLDKYDESVKKKRLNEYMKTNYEKPVNISPL